MPSIRQPGFASGELAPGMWGRTDLSVYEQGLRRCENFIITDTGSASMRPGMETLRVFEATSARITTHSGYQGSVLRRLLLIFTPGRVHVTPVGADREPQHDMGYASSPYGADDLPHMKFFQLGVYTLITCPGHPTREVFGGVTSGLTFRVYNTSVPAPMAPGYVGVLAHRRYGGVSVVRFSAHMNLYDERAAGNVAAEYGFEVSPYGLRVLRPDGGLLYNDTPLVDGGFQASFQNVTAKEFAAWASEVVGGYNYDDGVEYPAVVLTTELDLGISSAHVTLLIGTEEVGGRLRLKASWSTDVLSRNGSISLTVAESPTPPAGTFEYRVTLVREEAGVSWEIPVSVFPALNFRDSPTLDNPVVLRVSLSNSAVEDGVKAFRFYRGRGIVFGYVGSITEPYTGALFYDSGTEPNWHIQPPTPGDPIPADRPPVVATHHERLFMAGSSDHPNRLYGSRVDSFQDFFVPENKLTEDDAPLYLDLGGDDYEVVTDLVSMFELLAFTDRAVWSIRGPEGEPLTAVGRNSAHRNSFDPQRGKARALQVHGGVVYQTRGRFLYLRYDWESRGYITNDLNAYTPHLLDPSTEGTASRSAFTRSPGPILWAVRDKSGDLLSYTFAPDTGVTGWARHPTNGKVLDVSVVKDGDQDYTLLAVLRGGRVHLERLFPVDFAGAAKFGDAPAAYLDAARLYTRDAYYFRRRSGEVEQLPHNQIRVKYDRHLAGKKVVAVLNDFQWVSEPTTVGQDGTVTITYRSDVRDTDLFWVGLPYTPELELLDLPVEKLRLRSVKRVGWEVVGGRGVWTGPRADQLVAWRQRTMSDGYDAPEAASELAEVYVRGAWTPRGSSILQQRMPLPLTVIGVTREGDISDD